MTVSAEPRPASAKVTPSVEELTWLAPAKRVVWKIARLLSIIFGVTVISFILIKLSPNDPALVALGGDPTPEQVAAMRAQLGLDQPAWRQYADWLWGVLHGDFGTTLSQPARSVSGEILQRLPVTLELVVLTMVLALAIALPLAIWSARREGSFFDRSVSSMLYVFVSVPGFVAALIIALVFVFHADTVRQIGLGVGCLGLALGPLAFLRARRRGMPVVAIVVGTALVVVVGLITFALLPDFPRQGFTPISDGLGANLRGVALPVLSLTLIDVAIFTRLLRGDMVAELAKPYVLASRARGMPTQHVLLTEVLRPSMFSLVTVVGLSIGQLIGGTIIVEQVFRLPGIGSLLVSAIRGGDFPVVQACIFLIATTYVAINALVDASYSLLDPRVRR